MTLLEFIFIIASILLLGVAIAGLSIWVCKATTICLHSYERIDGYDSKKIILVCRKCGKIKRLRK